MADTLRLNIRQFAREYIREHQRCDPDDVLAAIYESFGDEIRENYERETREGIRRMLKDEFARDDEDSDAVAQTKLEGFSWPKVLTVPHEGGITWVDGQRAIKADVSAHRVLKEANIANARRKLDVFDMKIDRLAPAWAHNADFTVGECIDYLAAQQK